MSQIEIKTDEKIKEEEEKNEKMRTGGIFLRHVDFADDTDIYLPKFSTEARISYWSQLLSNASNHKIPDNQVTWVDENRTNMYEVELKNYSCIKILLLKIITTSFWDYSYLVFLIIWLAMLSMQLSHTNIPYLNYLKVIDIMNFPLGAMFITQSIPIFGVLYFIPCCNDLTRFMAQKNLCFWVIIKV